MNALTPSHTLHSLATKVSRFDRQKPSSEQSEMSFQKSYKEQLVYEQSARTYRQFFAKRWQVFIRENFANATHVAAAFSVTVVTAQNWWDGYNAPQGWVVARAMTDPELSHQASKHLAGGARCEDFAAE